MLAESSATESVGLASIVNRISGLLEHRSGVLSAGDVAAIRRMDPRSPAAPFFKLAGFALDDQLPSAVDARLEGETRWAAIVVGLAHLGMLHRPGQRLGHALVQTGFSELRFSRLIRADDDRLVDELPMLARFLAAKGTPVDWVDAARLALSNGRSDEEIVRRRVARDYYSALTRSNND